MTPDKIAVLIFGIAGLIFTYWFFFMKKIQNVAASGSINILVKGGFTPESITIPFGKKTELVFDRRDASTCLEEVVLADFKIRKFLPLNEKTAITILPDKKGIFNFSCGMGMFHGKLIVK